METIFHSVNGRTFEIQFAIRTVASHDLILAWPLEEGIRVPASASRAVANADEIETAFAQVAQSVKEQLDQLTESGEELSKPSRHNWKPHPRPRRAGASSPGPSPSPNPPQ